MLPEECSYCRDPQAGPDDTAVSWKGTSREMYILAFYLPPEFVNRSSIPAIASASLNPLIMPSRSWNELENRGFACLVCMLGLRSTTVLKWSNPNHPSFLACSQSNRIVVQSDVACTRCQDITSTSESPAMCLGSDMMEVNQAGWFCWSTDILVPRVHWITHGVTSHLYEWKTSDASLFCLEAICSAKLEWHLC